MIIGAINEGNINKMMQNENNLKDNMMLNPAIKNEVDNKTVAGVQKKDINKVGECKTCAERRYQDDSDDSGVSFQSPTRLTPQQASSAVISHEKEHYGREEDKAKTENKEVLSNSIRVYSAICPDCGKAYIAGGETRTVTRTRPKETPSPVKEPQVDGLRLDVGV